MKKIKYYDTDSVYLTESQTRYYMFSKMGYGVREIARKCGVSAATVSRTLKTVERKLKGAD